MDIYNNEIKKLYGIINNSTFQSNMGSDFTCDFTYDEDNLWPLRPKDEIILRSDLALELGAGNNYGIGALMLTTDPELCSNSGVMLAGPDIDRLSEVDVTSADYVRFTIIRLKDEIINDYDNARLYSLFRKIDYLKFNRHPEGFAVCISSKMNKETVRISREALANGITLNRVGNAMIKEYLQYEEVENARILYVVNPEIDNKNMDVAVPVRKGIGGLFGRKDTASAIHKKEASMHIESLITDMDSLSQIASKCEQITESLNTIFNGLVMDCNSCAQKSLCDEIDGIRQLHEKSGKLIDNNGK